MYYLQLTVELAQGRKHGPKDVLPGPFADADEARGYFTKLKMWFPETMQGADYRIVNRARTPETLQDHSA